MRVACIACAAEYEFPVELLAGQEVRVRCSACGTDLMVGPYGARHPAARPGAVSRRPAPSRRPLPPLPRAPRAAPAADPPPEPEPGAPSGLLGYLLVAGRRPVPIARRRRVVVVTRPGGTRPPSGARVISLPANFGKRWHAAPATEPPALPEVGAAAAPPAWPDRVLAALRPHRHRVALAAAAAVALAVVAVWPEAKEPAKRRVVTAPGAEAPTSIVPDEPASAPPLPDPQGVLAAETVRVELLPDEGAVLVQGYLHNGTDVPQGDVRIEAVLVVDDRPRRRREVLCCDAFRPEVAAAVARNQEHAHFRQHAPGPDQVRLQPGEEQVFSVIFPHVPASLRGGQLTARVRVLDARPMLHD